jgi:hypothetical protein
MIQLLIAGLSSIGLVMFIKSALRRHVVLPMVEQCRGGRPVGGTVCVVIIFIIINIINIIIGGSDYVRTPE